MKNQIKGLTDKMRAKKMQVGSVNHIFENTGSGCVERNESVTREAAVWFLLIFFFNCGKSHNLP